MLAQALVPHLTAPFGAGAPSNGMDFSRGIAAGLAFVVTPMIAAARSSIGKVSHSNLRSFQMFCVFAIDLGAHAARARLFD